MELRYPWFLLLYLPMILLVIYNLKRREPSLSVPSLKPFLSASKGAKIGLLPRIPFILFCISLALFIFALARPQKGVEEIINRTEGIDIMIAMDLSGSMQAIDVPERIQTEGELRSAIESKVLKTRIDTAKEEIAKFIEGRPNDRIGLIAFAPLPYVACPPTLDHNWLYAHLDRLQPGVIGDSTGIAGPLASAVNRLKDSEAKRKIIVLFTDGRNNVNAKITPVQAAKLAKQFKVTIYTVGIGTPNAIIKQRGFMGGEQYIPLAHEFDEKLLKDIAEISGGKYYAAKDAEGLEKTMKEIVKLEKTSMEQPIFVDYKDLAFPFIKAGIILLILSFVSGSTLFLRIP